MKINKSFLSKIIKEEIKKVLYDSHKPWEVAVVRKMVDIFNDIHDGKQKSREEYIAHIQQIINDTSNKETPEQAFDYFKEENAVDPDMFEAVAGYLYPRFSDDQIPASYKDIHAKYKEMAKGYVKHDAGPSSTFLRKPKSIDPQDQEDVRKNRKTLIHEEEQPDAREAKGELYVRMPPQKFLQLAASDVSCEERVSKFSIKKYDETGLRGNPVLRIDALNNKVFYHDGRGRACLAINNKLSEINVALVFYKEDLKTRAIRSWDYITKIGYITNQDGTENIDLSGIRLINEPPDWPRRLRIYAVKYIDKSDKQTPSEKIDYNINSLIIDMYLNYPNIKQPIEVYRLIPNKSVKSGEPPYELDNEGRVVLKNKNLEDESVWEKVPKDEWDSLPAHRK